MLISRGTRTTASAVIPSAVEAAKIQLGITKVVL